MKTSQTFTFTFCVVASVCVALCLPVLAQNHPNSKSVAKEDARTTEMKQKLQDAAQKGFALATKTNVSQSASIQAVLIPASLAKRIFGKEVSQNYAVVELIVSNEDDNAALVVHSVFLDYGQWILSGTSKVTPPIPNGPTSQVFNKPSQVASIEARLVRGEMLDAQQWTARNWTVRSLTALGTIATGFAFPFSGDVVKGIGAFNGTVVPAASTLWPDGTVNQINRVSDFGFQTNKVIPKQGSDILVAFFPIQRFLTPGFREVFLKDPAALFVPSEMLADPKTEPYFEDLVKPWASNFLVPCEVKCDTKPGSDDSASTAGQQSFQAQMWHAMVESNCSTITANASDGTKGNTAAEEGSVPVPADKSGDASKNQLSANHDNLCKLQELLNGVSLNNIRIGLEGAMTVDVSTIPATIYDVQFDSGNTDTSIWTKANTKQTGTITGVYLTGGDPEVVDSKGTKYSEITITKDTDGSSDTELHFTMTISKCVPPTSTIYFVVNKTPNQNEQANATKSNTKSSAKTSKNSNAPIASTPYQFPLPAYECPASTTENGAAGTNGDQDRNKDKTEPTALVPSTTHPKDSKSDEQPKNE
jgi:hypothetical protein